MDPLSLSDPVGAYTGRKLAALGNDPATLRPCLAAGIEDEPAPTVGRAGLRLC